MDAGRAAGEQPVLLLCAHGSRAVAAQLATARVTAAVQEALPHVEVRETWVDVQTPDVGQRCDELAARPVVVVPLLLSAGYHVRHDLARAVRGRERHVVADALGPDRRLSRLLARRLAEVEPGGRRGDGPVVLIAAGSSDARAADDVRGQAEDLARLLGRPVTAGFLSAASPTAAEAVAAVRATTAEPVSAVSFLLAAGTFHDQAAAAGADRLSAPLLGPPADAEATAPAAAVPPELVDLVLERWRQGLTRLS